MCRDINRMYFLSKLLLYFFLTGINYTNLNLKLMVMKILQDNLCKFLSKT